MNTRQFVDRYNIRADVVHADSNPNIDTDYSRDTPNHWRVTLRMAGRQFTVPFTTGSALGEPDAADVLDSLASDASTYDYTRDFEEWASELGYDTDSRKAERTYEIVRRQRLALRKFLGDDLYDALLTETERL